ncbi:MAG: carboxymuconolactone decarboxylase family protein [Alphaproteobacteria bacterium]|nr:carboxymuconolactone decarboxylase family protein [Alphaproteobacteria bacterium]
MSRLTPVDPAVAAGKTKTLLDAVQKKLGAVPNLLRVLGNSPAALQAYLGLSETLGGSSLDAKTRELIALTVAGANDCDYCASAHSAIGKSLGLEPSALTAGLEGRSADPKTQAALRFAKVLVEKRGWASEEDLAAVRAAGHGEGEIVEIVAAVALNIFTNYTNHVADTEIDFPVVRASKRAA